jgi:hypothetical protein
MGFKTLASWLSWDESTSRLIRESDPSTRRLPDASNSDYNDLSIHAMKTYHQLHESYPKDKFKNNDRHYQPCTDLHEKQNNPTQKQQTNIRQLHENLHKNEQTTKKQLLKLPTKKHHNTLTIFASAEPDEDSNVVL